MDSNKDILNRAIGRPAMMAFMILVGTYLTTGQLIPGVYLWKIKSYIKSKYRRLPHGLLF